MDFDLSGAIEWSPLSLCLQKLKTMKSITDKNSLRSQCHTNENSSQKLKTMNTAPLVIPLQSDCCRATMSVLRRTLQEWNVRVSIITFLTVKTGHETGLTDVSATFPAQLVQTEEPGRQWSENGNSSHFNSTIRTFTPLAAGASSKYLGPLPQISSFPSYCRFSNSLFFLPHIS